MQCSCVGDPPHVHEVLQDERRGSAVSWFWIKSVEGCLGGRPLNYRLIGE
ncbi:UNVERIFIED_CONTAM: hypothetical protein FKN15_070406 [Acipenser sinensis]